jgi:hypothetical protein
LIFNGETNIISEALKQIIDVLSVAWKKTRNPEKINGQYFSQLKERLANVYKVHPEYQFPSSEIGSIRKPSFDELLDSAIPIEKVLDAPFKVFIHGDFNIDNIIYTPNENKIHFIDLNRSREMDYVQDISVFIVSNFRVPVFEPEIRERLNKIILLFYKFGKEYAEVNNDKLFNARLTLGLVRNFITSTRFELNEDFAKAMYLRAVFLLEKLLDNDGKPWESFQLPGEALTY